MQLLRGHSESPRRCLTAVPTSGGTWPGSEMTHQAEAAGVEGTGGTGGPGCGARGRWRGLAAQNTATSRVGAEGAGGTGGTCCGARGRWRGLAGLRDNAPSEARGADVSRAGHRPRAHKAARPAGQHARHPEHQWGHKQPVPPAHTAAGHNGARPLVGTQNRPNPQGPGGSDNQREGLNAGSRRCRDHRDHFPDGRSKCRAWMRCPWRCLPCAGLRRRRWKSGWSIRQRSRRWFRRSRPGSGSEPAVRRTPGCRCH